MRPGLAREHGELADVLQRIVDAAWIIIAFVITTSAYRLPWQRAFSNATALAVIVFTLAAEICSLYRSWRSERLRVESGVVLKAWGTTVAALIVTMFATKTSVVYSRVASFGWFMLAPTLMIGWRLALRSVLRSLRTRGRNIRTVAIVGATQSAQDLVKRIRMRPWLGLKILGTYDDRGPNRRHAFTERPCPHLGTEADLIRGCRENKIDVVYIALPLRAEARINNLVRALADTTATVNLVADFFTYDLLCARWSSIGDFPIVSLHDTPFRGVDGGLKRLEDIVLSTIILAVIAIPLLVIALLVRITSPGGPVLFRQRRYGLNGKEIRILKFRTMTVCEDGPALTQVTRDDKRVTALGRFLRKTSMDELPQFLQVLTGEMSIVGPRPHAVAHNEQYRALIHGYMLRHKVKPGITGWAQINGWRGETLELESMEKRVAHDLEYIESWSLLWDIKIILLTIGVFRKSRNAF
jgi:putative colanic acid biosynthesis UDP-glucose lipid carrier transferase